MWAAIGYLIKSVGILIGLFRPNILFLAGLVRCIVGALVYLLYLLIAPSPAPVVDADGGFVCLWLMVSLPIDRPHT